MKLITLGIRTLEAHCSPGLLQFVRAMGKFEGLSERWWRGFEPTTFDLEITREVKPDRFATNVLAHLCLTSLADALWIVDSNCEPSQESFDLLRVDGDIVGGMVPVARSDRPKTEGPPYDWSVYRRTENPMEPLGYTYSAIPAEELKGSRVIPADAVGTACMLIRRTVLEHFAKEAKRDPQGIPGIFQSMEHPSGMLDKTADFDFCERAKAAGFSVKAHTGVRWGTSRRRDLSELVRACGDEAGLVAGGRNVDAA